MTGALLGPVLPARVHHHIAAVIPLVKHVLHHSCAVGAAAKIQAIQRGKHSRREHLERQAAKQAEKAEANSAATELQCVVCWDPRAGFCATFSNVLANERRHRRKKSCSRAMQRGKGARRDFQSLQAARREKEEQDAAAARI